MGDVLLSWRIQNIVFIMAVVIGAVIIVGAIGQGLRMLSNRE